MAPRSKKSSKSDEADDSLSWADLAKKVVFASLGSAAVARQAVKDSSLPREVLGSFLEKAEKRKEDILNMLAREVSKFLGKIDVSEEITKALKGLVINFQASIDFSEKKKGKRPHSKTTIHKAEVKRKS